MIKEKPKKCYLCDSTENISVHGFTDNGKKHWEYVCEKCHIEVHPEFALPLYKTRLRTKKKV